MKFNERLKDLRKSHNFTQDELAKRLGITPGAIGLYEQNRREPDNDTLKKLSVIFGVSIDYLLCVDEFQSPTILVAYNGTDPLKQEIADLTTNILNKIDDSNKLNTLKDFLGSIYKNW